MRGGKEGGGEEDEQKDGDREGDEQGRRRVSVRAKPREKTSRRANTVPVLSCTACYTLFIPTLVGPRTDASTHTNPRPHPSSFPHGEPLVRARAGPPLYVRPRRRGTPRGDRPLLAGRDTQCTRLLDSRGRQSLCRGRRTRQPGETPIAPAPPCPRTSGAVFLAGNGKGRQSLGIVVVREQ